MDSSAAALDLLTEQFRKMPGIGRKTAQRLAFYVLGLSDTEVRGLTEAITGAHDNIHKCACCCNLTEDELCPICRSAARDKGLVCVVESTQDLLAIENINEYNGAYHVLHGVISPLEGIGPDRLTIKELLARINAGGVREVILATNSSVEGEATAIYLSKLIKPLGVTVSRLAYGLPVGAELQYADGVTLSRAIEGRREF